MLWSISDLHLSTVTPKPMDVFGDRWKDHPARIAAAWQKLVKPDDTVLIVGDISWALKLTDALPDLQWIDALPGRKILSRGNHDYWWESSGRVRRQLPSSLQIVQGDAVVTDEAVICGTRGWLTPDMPGFQPATDMTVYNRELVRLDNALTAAQRTGSQKPLVVMIHYPPFLGRRPTEFAQKIIRAGAAACVYGHLHRPHDWASAVQGVQGGCFFQLTACDYLGFTPVAVRGISPESIPATSPD